MADESLTGGVDAGGPRCPWCSAPIVDPMAVRCPSCGAMVREDPEAEAPGLTSVDPEAVLRSRAPQPRTRGILGWLSGEVVDEGPATDHDTIAPPPADVLREMRRLEVDALLAEIAAQGGSAAFDAGSEVAGSEIAGSAAEATGFETGPSDTAVETTPNGADDR